MYPFGPGVSVPLIAIVPETIPQAVLNPTQRRLQWPDSWTPRRYVYEVGRSPRLVLEYEKTKPVQDRHHDLTAKGVASGTSSSSSSARTVRPRSKCVLRLRSRSPSVIS